MAITSTPHLPPNKLPCIKLPSLIYSTRDEWPFNCNQQTVSSYSNTHIVQKKMSTDVLLPPILPANSYSPPLTNLPDSPPYSSCSSLSVSSLPSSPGSVPDTSFNSPFCHVPQQHHSTAKRKGCSIQSLLNSGSELLALEREDQLNRSRKRISNNSNKRKRPATAATVPYFNGKKHAAVVDDTRNTKGLRLFSKQVCDKVAEKGITTYNEVADELAAEIQQKSALPVDQKNIRRRVYDALNVLMAMDIITKDRKQIKWLGLHHHHNKSFDLQDTNRQTMLEQEIKKEESRQKQLLDSIEKSKQDLNTTFEDFARLEKLIKQNQQNQKQQQQQTQTKQQTKQQTEVVHLPFFMVSSNENIHTHWNHSKEAVLYSNSACTVHHDLDILAKLWPSSKAPNVVS
ncbi:hypothetical protein INT46_009149 [Mucor plumbeus]|uniref:E2F/DP family winged-helix DNA-binding domain-containing protein n=1 Tax=Mucor plumbeus TaxID=97098 RepID=A0A8H7RCT3_9FUNG|nr:hypothetical protein INT46_009149 [Mucor plumbeus]